ncbi:MAG: putative Na+/H+ antiporter [Proteobacteria bacterium]|nr:putative Na+/H+ antiporter [Pseudomonadota bacterium]
MNPTTMQIVAAVLFALALIHTFSTKLFDVLSHKMPRHAGLFHLLAEVEVVFGLWAMILALIMLFMTGSQPTLNYLESLNFTEPLFVFAIMVMAGTRAVLQVAGDVVRGMARITPMARGAANYWVVMWLVPLMGSFITEPAAMTLAALLLRDTVFAHAKSDKLLYGSLGLLFVNISIGGTLTSFAAPPVLMVAAAWGWDTSFMLTHFGWKAALAAIVNASLFTAIFYKELAAMPKEASGTRLRRVPLSVVAVHLLLLAGVVASAHYPVVFLGIFLAFMGYSTAYERHQERLILREALLVAFFLAGLVVLGGQQRWWLQPLLMRMDANEVFWGATALTAITDNAALTYLGSLVDGLTLDFKMALVMGAVTGGGLTVVANAPNPAGISILRSRFPGETVNALSLLVAALVPTLIAAAAFRLL